jgi:uncharacterized protein (TIGR03083 family)
VTVRAASYGAAVAMVCEERTSLANFVAGLSDQQWEAPSLCALWRVRDVVAHVLSYDDLSKPGWARRYCIDARCSIDRFNQIGVDFYADASDVELTALLRERTQPRGYMAAFPRIGLLDAMIHQQDIRRAIEVARTIPDHRLRAALYASLRMPLTRGAWRARGLRLVAEDVHWSFGAGKTVAAPGEALLMALAGRPTALADLQGSGAEIFRSRFH